jgi:hypothetical protein
MLNIFIIVATSLLVVVGLAFAVYTFCTDSPLPTSPRIDNSDLNELLEMAIKSVAKPQCCQDVDFYNKSMMEVVPKLKTCPCKA